MHTTINKGITKDIITITTNSQENIRRQKISEVLAIVAMALVLTYITDAAVVQGKQGFLRLNAVQRGMTFGASSIIFVLPFFWDWD
jgi:hypothetical protein